MPSRQTSRTPAERRRLIADAGVMLVTEEALSLDRDSEAIAAAALEAGVRLIQVREKESSGRRLYQVAVRLRELTRRHGALLIVNDRADVAMAVDADGVHIGQDDLPLPVARRLLGPDAVIGLSITAAGQLTASDAAEADYLGVGAVYPTDAKLDATIAGLELVRQARAGSGLPVIAIGGIQVDNAEPCFEAGADGVAVITALTRADDPRAAAERLMALAAGARRGRSAAQ